MMEGMFSFQASYR